MLLKAIELAAFIEVCLFTRDFALLTHIQRENSCFSFFFGRGILRKLIFPYSSRVSLI